MTTYDHRCVSRIYLQNIMCNVTHTDKFYKLHKIASTAVAGWHTLWRKEQRCPPAHFCVYGICIITNNGAFIKYRTKTPQTIFHLTHQCVFTEISTPNSPYWRRYTFLRVRLRNRRFLPHPQKNWSPLPAACTYLYNCISICTHRTPVYDFRCYDNIQPLGCF